MSIVVLKSSAFDYNTIIFLPVISDQHRSYQQQNDHADLILGSRPFGRVTLERMNFTCYGLLLV